MPLCLSLDKLKCQKKRAELKLKAAEAFKRSEYMMAAEMYTVAMELGPSSDDYATLLANRSLCLLRLENGTMALKDATLCRMMRPNWPKACYRQGAAFMRLKDYEKACEAFADGLKLDPKAVDIENALREATAMKT
uniref:Serine/threonine-protein kinase BSK1-like TPR repeats domain-containing protein n=1 Tax=Aegilops tauschii subsp. strangulata TaxID=200361 RepID=A0A453ENY9_AEGTS